MVNFMSQPFYPHTQPQNPFNRRLGRPQSQCGHFAVKSSNHFPACSAVTVPTTLTQQPSSTPSKNYELIAKPISDSHISKMQFCVVTCESWLAVGVHNRTASDIMCASGHHGRIAGTVVSHHGVSRRWARHHAGAIDTWCLDRTAAWGDGTRDGAAAKDTVGTRLHHRTAHRVYVVHDTVILHHEK